MAGVDHQRVPLDVLAVLPGNPQALPALRARCGGVVALVTCHRRELYVEGVTATAVEPLFECWLGRVGVDGAVVRVGDQAVEHLLRVAAGLESAVLGEDQILGQLRSAYRAACAGALAGPVLHRLFHAAFRTGKRVRNETELAAGGRSLAGTAVNLLGRLLGHVGSATVAVLGAGEMATVAAHRLRDRGAGRILICSRTFARAVQLAQAVGGEALPWEWRLRALAAAQGVIAAVSSSAAVITADELLTTTAGRNFVAVDLGLPRNLERPEALPVGVRLIDLDGLRARLAEHAHERANAVAAATRIVAQEAEALAAWLASRQGSDVHSRAWCRRPALG